MSHTRTFEMIIKDFEYIDEQAHAWMSVVDTLDKCSPGWRRLADTCEMSAVRAIESLANKEYKPLGYVMKTGHGNAFRESLEGVNPEAHHLWTKVYKDNS